MISLICSTLLSLFILGANGKDDVFNSNWAAFPKCLQGQAQSPIDIVSADAVYDAEKGKVDFKWETGDSVQKVFVENDGETVFITAETFSEKTVLDTGTFFVHLINFHWPKPGGKASEHAIDGTKFDGEIEFIHAKEGITDLERAFDNEGDAIGVSVLLEEDPTLEEDIEGIEFLKSHLEKIVGAETSVEIPFVGKSLSLKKFIPGDGAFYRYTGSNTVTACVEGMERIVFKDTIKVTSALFAKLRKVKAKVGGGFLEESFNRDLQASNGRTVYKSWK